MVIFNLTAQEFDGYVLYNTQNQSTAYLLDIEGDIVHQWNCDQDAGYATLLMETGNIMRAAINSGNAINGPAVAGRVQEIDPNGDIVWDFTYSSSSYVSHHDIALMPNGGVLLTAWDVRSSAEMGAMGMTNPSSKYPTRLIEVQNDGNGGGEIVWTWELYDHLVNDVDTGSDNYGVIVENPQLLDVNVETGGGGGPGGGGGDWIHCNGIYHDPIRDQICFSSRYLSEVFIIDHSTTTEEAAGHTAGNAGKGGDFLYRWGNPSNYGASNPQTIDGPCHDARFLETDRPNAGWLQFFNNDGANGGDSQVTAINPEMDADGYNYVYTPGAGYGPVSADWEHDCVANSAGQSAADQMPNGNIFVALSDAYMYEATPDGDVIWQYAQSPQKAFRYTCDHPGIVALLGDNPCGIIDGVEEIDQANLYFFPNPTSDRVVYINGLLNGLQITNVQVIDICGKQLAVNFDQRKIDMSGADQGIYIVSIIMENGQVISERISLID